MTDDKTQPESGKRLGQILGVLKKHKITKGLTPVKLREILEDLGPTYIKIGQIMSMRSDVLPEEYCEELTSLRTDVPSMPYETVREVVEGELHEPLEKNFQSVTREPLGSASIAQAHAAVLKNGEPVVLKVQRPGIRKTMENDINLLRRAAGLLNLASGVGKVVDFRAVIEEMWETSKDEMDFHKESENLIRFAKNQKGIRYITSPSVYTSMTTEHLLVMSNVKGVQIDNRDVLLSYGYDMNEIARKTALNYVKQIIDDGFFQADPHPGNLRIADGKIAWIDLGMMGEVSVHLRTVIGEAVEAVFTNDMYALTSAILSIGKPEGKVDRAILLSEVDTIIRRYRSMDFGNMNIGKLFQEVLDVVRENHIEIPSELTLMCRSMLTIEGTLALVSPEVSLMQILSSYMKQKRREQLDIKSELMHGVRDLYASSKKAVQIPLQLSDTLNLLKNGAMTLHVVESPDEGEKHRKKTVLMLVIVCILTAVFYLSGALLCLTDIQPEVLNLPYPAFFFFAIGTVFLAFLLVRLAKLKHAG